MRCCWGAVLFQKLRVGADRRLWLGKEGQYLQVNGHEGIGYATTERCAQGAGNFRCDLLQFLHNPLRICTGKGWLRCRILVSSAISGAKFRFLVRCRSFCPNKILRWPSPLAGKYFFLPRSQESLQRGPPQPVGPIAALSASWGQPPAVCTRH